MKADDTQTKPLADAEAREETRSEPLLGSRVGWLTPGAQGALLVDFEGNRLGPVPARTTVSLSPEQRQHAIASRQGVLLMFENGDPSRPLILGLVQEASASPLVDAILDGLPVQEGVEATVDGKPRVIELEGAEEVTLRCGQASITLRRDGKVLIRGSYVETRATGTNRIKGGSVQIN